MKLSKRILAALLAALTMFSLTACASRPAQTQQPAQAQQPSQQETPAADGEANADSTESEAPAQDNAASADAAAAEEPAQEAPTETAPAEEPVEEVPAEGGKTLVVYYSASGNTAAVAGYIADALDADTFELVPQEQYSSDDLNWRDSGSRVNREHEDESLRDIALVANSVENWDEYDTVFIGYPIWWAIAAWPVNNFVKNNDFTGKTVIPFCTSTSSGMGQSGELLAEMAGTGDWQEGQRFRSGASQSDVTDWVSSLGLN